MRSNTIRASVVSTAAAAWLLVSVGHAAAVLPEVCVNGGGQVKVVAYDPADIHRGFCTCLGGGGLDGQAVFGSYWSSASGWAYDPAPGSVVLFECVQTIR